MSRRAARASSHATDEEPNTKRAADVPDAATLIDSLAATPSDGTIDPALRRLAAHAEMPVLLATVQAMVRCGVPGLASRLLASLRADADTHGAGELDALRDGLRKMPTGEAPREQLERRHAQNLRSLKPAIAGALDDFETTHHRFAVYRTVCGNLQVAHRDDRGPLRMALRYADHRREAAALQLPAVDYGTAYRLVGTPSPPLLERLLAARTDTGYEPPIDLIENDPAMLGLLLTMVDLGDAVATGRLELFTGADAVERYVAFLGAHEHRRPSTQQLTMPRPGWTPPVIDQRTLEPVTAAAEQRRVAASTRQRELYADADVASWASRFRSAAAGEQPLRVIGFTTRFSTVIQHAMRDLAGAFRRRGCEFELCIEPHDWCGGVSPLVALSRHRYDLVIVVNHIRSEAGGQIHANIPYVCWIQDHMPALWSPSAGASIGPLDLVVGHGPRELFEIHGYPRERFLPTSNLTDAVTYHDGAVPGPAMKQLACDLSYVSHGSPTARRMVEEIAPDRALHRYLDRIVELLEQGLDDRGWVNTVEQARIVLQAEAESGHRPLSAAERQATIVPAMWRLLDRLFRHQTLAWARDWANANGRTLRIYGRGWDEHETLAPHAAGEIANGERLRCLHRASRVNLQVNAYGSMHQRLLDCVASGGFVITRFNPADHRHAPHRVVAETIRRHGLGELAEVLELAETDAALGAALDRIDRLTGARIARQDDPVRLEQRALMQQVFELPDTLFTDAGLFELLATMHHLPPRGACDIDGFGETGFETPEQLAALLGAHVDDASSRAAVTGRMRPDVLEHDTYDALVASLLDRFEQLLEASAGATREDQLAGTCSA